MARQRLDIADQPTRAKLARAAAELASAARTVDERTAAVRTATRAVATARHDYVDTWDDFASAIRTAHEQGVSVAELSRITGFGVSFIRPIVLGLTTAPRPQGRRPRQLDDHP